MRNDVFFFARAARQTKTAILGATTGAYSCNHPLMECVPSPLLKRVRMTGLDLAAAIPNFDAQCHDFRADPDDPQRIWCQTRVTGTQTGQLFFGSRVPLSYVRVCVSCVRTRVHTREAHTSLGGARAKPRDPPVTLSNPPEAGFRFGFRFALGPPRHLEQPSRSRVSEIR